MLNVSSEMMIEQNICGDTFVVCCFVTIMSVFTSALCLDRIYLFIYLGNTDSVIHISLDMSIEQLFCRDRLLYVELY